ncbi:MAG: HU family DNA-binding protein [Candidatus Berkelbacteria bacterium]
MNKNDLAKKISKESDIPTPKAEKLITAFGEAVTSSLARDERLVLSNFGTFHAVHYPQKTLLHPATREKMVIPPQNVVKWLPSDKFKYIFRDEELSEKFIEEDVPEDPFESKEYAIPIAIKRKNDFSVNTGSATEIPIKVTNTQTEVETYDSDEVDDIFFKGLAGQLTLATDKTGQIPSGRHISDTEVSISREKTKDKVNEKPIEIKTSSQRRSKLPKINTAVIDENTPWNKSEQKKSDTKDKSSVWINIFGHEKNVEKLSRPQAKKLVQTLTPHQLHRETADKIYIDANEVCLDSKVTDLVPYDLLIKYNIVPVKLQNSNLVLLMTDPYDYDIIFELNKILPYRIIPALSSFSDIEKLLNEIPQRADKANAALATKKKYSPARILDTIVRRALRNKAKSIEITPSKGSLITRYDDDDDSIKVYDTDDETSLEVFNRIKKLSHKKAANTGLQFTTDGHHHEFKILTIKKDGQERINIQVLY